MMHPKRLLFIRTVIEEYLFGVLAHIRRKCGGLCPGLKGAALIMRGVRFCKLRGQSLEQILYHSTKVKSSILFQA
ncbi:hypothetical protein KY284_033021 [Solanum tuberosum]|nr:hypothetical protein KY284_033021 [Solanum tuberosum]